MNITTLQYYAHIVRHIVLATLDRLPQFVEALLWGLAAGATGGIIAWFALPDAVAEAFVAPSFVVTYLWWLLIVVDIIEDVRLRM